MHASQILRDKGREVFSVSPNASLVEAAKVLNDKRVGAAVVLDDKDKPVGVFSERDLARLLGTHGEAALASQVSDVMSTRLITAGSSATIDQLMEIMTERRCATSS